MLKFCDNIWNLTIGLSGEKFSQAAMMEEGHIKNMQIKTLTSN